LKTQIGKEKARIVASRVALVFGPLGTAVAQKATASLVL
jgi:hypothetical protein